MLFRSFLDNCSIYAISNSNYYRNGINDFNDGRVIDCHNHSGAKKNMNALTGGSVTNHWKNKLNQDGAGGVSVSAHPNRRR